MDTDKAILARLECIIELLATMHPKNPDVSLGLEDYTISWEHPYPGVNGSGQAIFFGGDGPIIALSTGRLNSR